MICRTANITARGLITIAIAPFSREKKTRLICRSWQQIWSLITNFSMPKLPRNPCPLPSLCRTAPESVILNFFDLAKEKGLEVRRVYLKLKHGGLVFKSFYTAQIHPYRFFGCTLFKKIWHLQGSNIPTQSCDLSLLIGKLT